ncbi:MAG: nuclear transport factor 2 family protein [Candidatus Dormibacteria bacterium]
MPGDPGDAGVDRPHIDVAMSDEHPNALAYRRTADAFRSADQAVLEQLIANDVVWHVPGTHPMAGDLQGRDELLPWLKRLRAQGFWLTEHDVFGNDDHVCALSVITGRPSCRRRGNCLFGARRDHTNRHRGSECSEPP